MNEKGQSLFEVLIALAVSAVIIVSLVSLVSAAIRNSNFSKSKNIAARYAEETTEWIRNQRDLDILTFKTRVATPIWCMPDLSWSITGHCGNGNEISGTSFYREAFFTSDVVSGKTIIEATVIVYWVDSQGLHQISSSTNFSDWRER